MVDKHHAHEGSGAVRGYGRARQGLFPHSRPLVRLLLLLCRARVCPRRAPPRARPLAPHRAFPMPSFTAVISPCTRRWRRAKLSSHESFLPSLFTLLQHPDPAISSFACWQLCKDSGFEDAFEEEILYDGLLNDLGLILRHIASSSISSQRDLHGNPLRSVDDSYALTWLLRLMADCVQDSSTLPTTKWRDEEDPCSYGDVVECEIDNFISATEIATSVIKLLNSSRLSGLQVSHAVCLLNWAVEHEGVDQKNAGVKVVETPPEAAYLKKLRLRPIFNGSSWTSRWVARVADCLLPSGAVGRRLQPQDDAWKLLSTLIDLKVFDGDAPQGLRQALELSRLYEAAIAMHDEYNDVMRLGNPTKIIAPILLSSNAENIYSTTFLAKFLPNVDVHKDDDVERYTKRDTKRAAVAQECGQVWPALRYESDGGGPRFSVEDWKKCLKWLAYHDAISPKAMLKLPPETVGADDMEQILQALPESQCAETSGQVSLDFTISPRWDEMSSTYSSWQTLGSMVWRVCLTKRGEANDRTRTLRLSIEARCEQALLATSCVWFGDDAIISRCCSPIGRMAFSDGRSATAAIVFPQGSHRHLPTDCDLHHYMIYPGHPPTSVRLHARMTLAAHSRPFDMLRYFHVHHEGLSATAPLPSAFETLDWLLEQRKVGSWGKDYPKPLALFEQTVLTYMAQRYSSLSIDPAFKRLRPAYVRKLLERDDLDTCSEEETMRSLAPWLQAAGRRTEEVEEALKGLRWVWMPLATQVGLQEASLTSLLSPFAASPGIRRMMDSGLSAKLGTVKRARDEEGAELTCPISFELFVDPVVAADGNTYERAAIEAWFERGNGRGRSPLTRELMKSQTLVPNRIVKKLADAFREQQQATRKRSRFDCDEPPPLNLLG